LASQKVSNYPNKINVLALTENLVGYALLGTQTHPICLGNVVLSEQHPTLYNIVCHERDLVSPRLASWNVMLHRLALVHLMGQTSFDGICMMVVYSL
jgi:hypothetical protein